MIQTAPPGAPMWWEDWQRRVVAHLDANAFLRRTSWGTRPELHLHRQYDGDECKALGMNAVDEETDLWPLGLPRASAPWPYRMVTCAEGLAFVHDAPVLSFYRNGRSRYYAPAPLARVWNVRHHALRHRSDNDRAARFYAYTLRLDLPGLAAFAALLERAEVVATMAPLTVPAYLAAAGFPPFELDP